MLRTAPWGVPSRRPAGAPGPRCLGGTWRQPGPAVSAQGAEAGVPFRGTGRRSSDVLHWDFPVGLQSAHLTFLLTKQNVQPKCRSGNSGAADAPRSWERGPATVRSGALSRGARRPPSRSHPQAGCSRLSISSRAHLNPGAAHGDTGQPSGCFGLKHGLAFPASGRRVAGGPRTFLPRLRKQVTRAGQRASSGSEPLWAVVTAGSQGGCILAPGLTPGWAHPPLHLP